MKEQKGITLVALIITIIVMLILVAVTISIALNGGLFDKARTASRETRIAQVKEAIAMAKADIIADYYDPTNTTGDVTYLEASAPSNTIVQKYINGYLDEKVLKVKVPSAGTTSATGTSYTVQIDTVNDSINTDIGSTTFDALVLDMWKTTTPSGSGT